MGLKLEVGRNYNTRDGRQVLIDSACNGALFFYGRLPPGEGWKISRVVAWRADGSMPPDSTGRTEFPSDLVDEVYVNGWIEWGGGSNPPEGEIRRIKLRNGCESRGEVASMWTHDNRENDIVAYKIAGAAAADAVDAKPTLAGDSLQATTFIPLSVLDAMTEPDPRRMPVMDAMAGVGEIKTTNPKDLVGTKKAPMSTVSAAVLAEVGVAMLEGALKYGRHNYRVAGVRASVYYDGVMRHLMSWWEGEDIDPESGLSHVTKAITSLVVLRDAMIQDMVTDDRPPRSADFYTRLNQRAKELVEDAQRKGLNPRHYVAADTGLKL